MKKIFLIIVLSIGVTVVYAQSSKVQSGFTHMKYNELDKAKECLDKAAIHSKTSVQAKTWYFRGQCYQKLSQTANQTFKDLEENPLMVASISFQKAMELDSKKRFEKELVFEIQRSASQFFNKGGTEFEEGEFEKSLESFEQVIKIGALPYINQLDTGAYFNAAIAADQAGLSEKALAYYNKTAEFRNEGSKIYKYIADIYFQNKDTLSALKAYQAGIEAYPDENVNLYIELVNFYLGKADYEQAYGYIEKAIEKDNLNASLWYALGMAGESKAPDGALSSFQKAIDLNPQYWEAMYMAGKIHYDRGVEAINRAQLIPLDDSDGYKKLKEEADAHFKLALPFFEQAFAIEKHDFHTLSALKELYYRFKMNNKLVEIKKLLDKMK